MQLLHQSQEHPMDLRPSLQKKENEKKGKKKKEDKFNSSSDREGRFVC